MVRACRRFVEMQAKNEPITYAQLLADLERRDAIDSQRALSPLVPAADAHKVDTDASCPEEIVEVICRLLAKA